MKKVLYVATNAGFLSDFQIENMKIWKSMGYDIHCAANFQDPQYNRRNERFDEVGIVPHQIDFVRNPLSKQNMIAYKQLYNVMNEEKFDVLDTHNPISSVLSRIAARRVGIKKVIYTVHGFFFYKGAPIKNHIIFRPIEFYLARYTDCLIVTNLEDYEIAKKMTVRGKAYYVPGVGVDVDEIKKTVVNRTNKRKEFGIPNESLLFICVGENIKRKNQETAIRAFAKIKIDNSYLLIIGEGELHEHLKKLSRDLGLEEKVIFPGYRKDINEVIKMADIFVHPSYQEGLSVALMLAMAAELPVIASNIRGNVDCIIDGKGGMNIPPNDIDGFTNAMNELAEDNRKRILFGKYNGEKINEFSKKSVAAKYKEIFETVQ